MRMTTVSSECRPRGTYPVGLLKIEAVVHRNHKAHQPMSVRLDGANVVLTLTPQRAHVMAESLDHPDAVRAGWLDEVSQMLRAAAGRRGVSEAPPLTRGAFLRGGWITEDHELAADIQADLAAQAAAHTDDAVVAAAKRAAEAAEDARTMTALAVAAAAESVAETAMLTAAAVQGRADNVARTVADEAAEAATSVAASVPTGGEAEAAVTALLLEARVTAAAVVKAEETALAAAIVARAVAAAAAAVNSVAAATARQVAADTAAKAACVALAVHEAEEAEIVEGREQVQTGIVQIAKLPASRSSLKM